MMIEEYFSKDNDITYRVGDNIKYATDPITIKLMAHTKNMSQEQISNFRTKIRRIVTEERVSKNNIKYTWTYVNDIDDVPIDFFVMDDERNREQKIKNLLDER